MKTNTKEIRDQFTIISYRLKEIDYLIKKADMENNEKAVIDLVETKYAMLLERQDFMDIFGRKFKLTSLLF